MILDSVLRGGRTARPKKSKSKAKVHTVNAKMISWRMSACNLPGVLFQHTTSVKQVITIWVEPHPGSFGFFEFLEVFSFSTFFVSISIESSGSGKESI